MSDVDPVEDGPKKTSKMPLIIGMVLALLGGGSGFAVVSMGLLGGESDSEHMANDKVDESTSESASLAVSFVPIEPLVISINSQGERRLLRFSAQIEVLPEHAEEVTAIKPRIIDVLNGYLRAVKVADLENPAALMKLRGQMLYRIGIVAGTDKVRDLLIMEFVIN